MEIKFSFCLFYFMIFSMFLKGCGPLVLLSLQVLSLILRNLRAFFGEFLGYLPSCQEVESLELIWVALVPHGWVCSCSLSAGMVLYGWLS